MCWRCGFIAVLGKLLTKRIKAANFIRFSRSVTAAQRFSNILKLFQEWLILPTSRSTAAQTVILLLFLCHMRASRRR